MNDGEFIYAQPLICYNCASHLRHYYYACTLRKSRPLKCLPVTISFYFEFDAAFSHDTIFSTRKVNYLGRH